MKTPTGVIITKYITAITIGEIIEPNIKLNLKNSNGEYFVNNITNLIPMGRMAEVDEYKGAIIFLCSNASSYMTGQNLIIDGGRTTW